MACSVSSRTSGVDVKVIPELTAEQRREAHAKSLAVRQARAEIKRKIAHHCTIAYAWTQDAAQGMKVIDLLCALPGIGMRKSLALLQQAGIPSHNTVRACGPKQTERLFALLDNLKPRKTA
jgi:hypothetical protein